MFAIFYKYYIEDYYKVESFIGVVKTHEEASIAICVHALEDYERLWWEFVDALRYWDVEEMVKVDEEWLLLDGILNKTLISKPKFDQSQIGDREYVKMHTGKKWEWEAKCQEAKLNRQKRRDVLSDQIFQKYQDLKLAEPSDDFKKKFLKEDCNEYVIKEIEFLVEKETDNA